MKPLKTSTYHDLIEALAQPGCAVCRMLDRYTREYIDAFFHEQITNVARRAEIRAARGFCSVHASMLPAPSRMLGTAIVQHDVLNDVLREIDRAQLAARNALGAPGAAGAVARAVRPRRACTLCEFERDRERFVLSTLVNLIDEPELGSAFDRAAGICLPHLHAAMRVTGINRQAVHHFVGRQYAKMAALRQQLADYIAHSNGSYDFAGMGEEADAPLRATRLISGRVVHADARL